MTTERLLARSLAALVLAVCLLPGCRSARDSSRGGMPDDWVAAAVDRLSRPLPGPMAAIYRMRVPSTGGLRLSVVARADSGGRMTVSEPFGAAVVVAGWDVEGGAEVFDMKAGCRLSQMQAREAVGLGALPLDRALRLLGGRLPARPGDDVLHKGDGRLVISSADWQSEVQLADDPWRVIEVRSSGFTVELEKHTSSVPGRLRVVDREGDSVDLILSNLKWEAPSVLAALPDLPPCNG